MGEGKGTKELDEFSGIHALPGFSLVSIVSEPEFRSGIRMQDTPKTTKAAEFDVEAISILLIGSTEEQNEAIRLIDRHLQRPLFALIRRSGLSLRAEEVRDVYQEVALAILQAGREDRYDPDRPLLPFLFTIARRKAIDRVREKSKKTGDQEVLAAIADTLADTRVGEAWQAVASKNDGRRMMQAIQATIARMPERQRQVASVIVDSFPEAPSLKDIQQELQSRTSEPLTIVAIKSALREVRRKIRDQLVLAGYMERDTDGDFK